MNSPEVNRQITKKRKQPELPQNLRGGGADSFAMVGHMRTPAATVRVPCALTGLHGFAAAIALRLWRRGGAAFR